MGSAASAWIAGSVAMTLRAVVRLTELPESRSPAVVGMIRDLAEQAAIWVEILEEEGGGAAAEGGAAPESAVWLARLAAGLETRYREPPEDLPLEARRFATACLADVGRHRRTADGVLRAAERGGGSRRVHRLRAELPSVREFVATGPARDAATGG